MQIMGRVRLSKGSGAKRFGPRYIQRNVRANYQLYLLLLPVVAYYIIFKYWPIYGLRIAFMDYSPFMGFRDSPYVGLKHFIKLFTGPYFLPILINTLILSLYSLCMFPLPILFALFVSDIGSKKLKTSVQLVTVAPHFISMVVVVGMLRLFLAPSGIVNQLIKALGSDSINFFGESRLFPGLYVWSGVWQQLGWSSVIYVAALSSVDPQLHEAAIIDGASRWQRVIHVDIPGILTTIIILLLLRIGNLLQVGFEKVYLMQTDLNLGRSEIIDTYAYKVGLQRTEYSFSSAVSLFSSTVNFILLVTFNRISKKAAGIRLW